MTATAYAILIVDDETVERRGIQNLIQNLQLPFEITLAADGEEAFTLLKGGLMADVVITDIRMPFMDGLMLARKTHDLLPQTQIIIYSAYDEFEYARQAISAGVSEYLLKPIDITIFQQLMLRVLKRCEENRYHIEQETKLERVYARSLSDTREKLLRRLLDEIVTTEETKMLWDGKTQLVLLYTRKNFFDRNTAFNLPSLPEVSGYKPSPFCAEVLVLSERSQILFLHDFSSSYTDTALEMLAQQWLTDLTKAANCPCLVLLSTPFDHVMECSKAFIHIDDVLDHLAFFEESCVIWADRETLSQTGISTLTFRLVDEISVALERNDLLQVDDKLDQLFAIIDRANFLSFAHIRRICASLCRMAALKMTLMYADALPVTLEKIYACRDINQMYPVVKKWLEQIPAERKMDTFKAERPLVREVKRIIHAEYMHDIGLEAIAEKLDRTPGYVSSLFRIETGEPLLKYLTRYRMQVATELLLNTNKKSAEIAGLVGYVTPTYFGQVFRNIYGMSPGAYREKNKS
jgi:two-component system, response regulator YesN